MLTYACHSLDKESFCFDTSRPPTISAAIHLEMVYRGDIQDWSRTGLYEGDVARRSELTEVIVATSATYPAAAGRMEQAQFVESRTCHSQSVMANIS